MERWADGHTGGKGGSQREADSATGQRALDYHHSRRGPHPAVSTPPPTCCNGNQVKYRHRHQNKLQKLTFIYCTKVGLPFDTKSGFSTENPSLSEQYLCTLYYHSLTVSATLRNSPEGVRVRPQDSLQFVLLVRTRKLLLVKQRAALRTETCLFLNNCARKHIPFLKCHYG